MTAPEHGLSHLAVAMAPATLLRRLAGAADAPDVSVHLAGGSVLAGRPIGIGTDHGQEVIVLGGERGHLGYALLSSVVAVEVRDPERIQDVLTDGRLAPPLTGEPVTRLALRREFTPTEEFPLSVDWDALPDSAVALANLDRLLRGLREIAGKVRADELGRRAWERVRVLRVGHRAGERLSVRGVPDGLTLEVDLTAALPRDVGGELGRQVNALL